MILRIFIGGSIRKEPFGKKKNKNKKMRLKKLGRQDVDLNYLTQNRVD